MHRPNLPDFTDPPLDEVVLGVQFSPLPGYTSVGAGGVWDLYKDEFPNVQEQPQLTPQFETFGGISTQPFFHFQFAPPIAAPRLWFIGPEGSHLLQFQQDRLLLNWRKNLGIVPYPRYEKISDSFEKYLSALEIFSSNKYNSQLIFTQIEVSYINIIPVHDFNELSDWVGVWNKQNFLMENVNFNFSEIVADVNNAPIARLHFELTSAVTPDGQGKAFRLSMTYRGPPNGQGIPGAMASMVEGRRLIVKRFAAITTGAAHQAWGRCDNSDD